MENLAQILEDVDHDSKPCKCEKIETALNQMIDNAYDEIPPPDENLASIDQYNAETKDTNKMVYNAMKILCGIKCLCKYGRFLEEVYSGSIVFRMFCPNLEALLDLWQTYKVGNLQKDLQEAFVTDELLEQFGCEKIVLKVNIELKQYQECKQDLGK